ncbi:MAG: hypothetical protein C5S45_02830 [Candidatus Methanocomedens sp.]|nr:MAG: hypothetical protein C5S45_02830 [ANME-2 cluster archaeon]
MESGWKSVLKKAVSIMVFKQTGNEFRDFLLFPGMVYSHRVHRAFLLFSVSSVNSVADIRINPPHIRSLNLLPPAFGRETALPLHSPGRPSRLTTQPAPRCSAMQAAARVFSMEPGALPQLMIQAPPRSLPHGRDAGAFGGLVRCPGGVCGAVHDAGGGSGVGGSWRGRPWLLKYIIHVLDLVISVRAQI